MKHHNQKNNKNADKAKLAQMSQAIKDLSEKLEKIKSGALPEPSPQLISVISKDVIDKRKVIVAEQEQLMSENARLDNEIAGKQKELDEFAQEKRELYTVLRASLRDEYAKEIALSPKKQQPEEPIKRQSQLVSDDTECLFYETSPSVEPPPSLLHPASSLQQQQSSQIAQQQQQQQLQRGQQQSDQYEIRYQPVQMQQQQQTPQHMYETIPGHFEGNYPVPSPGGRRKYGPRHEPYPSPLSSSSHSHMKYYPSQTDGMCYASPGMNSHRNGKHENASDMYAQGGRRRQSLHGYIPQISQTPPQMMTQPPQFSSNLMVQQQQQQQGMQMQYDDYDHRKQYNSGRSTWSSRK